MKLLAGPVVQKFETNMNPFFIILCLAVLWAPQSQALARNRECRCHLVPHLNGGPGTIPLCDEIVDKVIAGGLDYDLSRLCVKERKPNGKMDIYPGCAKVSGEWVSKINPHFQVACLREHLEKVKSMPVPPVRTESRQRSERT